MKTQMFTRVGILVVAVCTTPASAQTLEVRVVTTYDKSGVWVLMGTTAVVPVYVQARLSGGASDGLAMISADLAPSVTFTHFDFCNQASFLLTAPTSPVDIKNHFDRNAGLTNPPGNPISGFSGTCDGDGGLLQIGGAQNTIGNSGAPVTYPSGSVLKGVGNNGYVTIASGTLTVTPMGFFGTAVRLVPRNIVAGVLVIGQAGPVYHVVEFPAANITVTGTLVIYSAQFPSNPDADVNCDHCVNGADILSVRAPGTWGTTGAPGWIRADVNHDGVVNGSDILSIRAPGVWGSCEPSGMCYP